MARETNTNHSLICLHGLAGDKSKSIINVQFSSAQILMDYLKKLQQEYILDDLDAFEKDEPRVELLHLPSKTKPGAVRAIYNCYSYSDWHYAAHIGLRSDKVELLYLM